MSKKTYFTKKKNREPSLKKILIPLLILAVAILLAGRYGPRLGLQWFGAGVQAEGPAMLEAARQLAREDKPDAALATLAPLISRISDPVLTPRALLLSAEIEAGRENDRAALEHLTRILDQYPGSAEHPGAAILTAGMLESTGETARALALYQELQNAAPPEMQPAVLLGLGRHHERAGDLIKARDFYREAAAGAKWNSGHWNEALDAAGRLNVSLIFSPGETPESRYYTVEAGDNLHNIGIKLNTTQGLLIRANNITDPASLRPGQRLKYTPKDFEIVVERGACRLFLLDKEGIFKRYPTGLGMPGYETTLGEYTIGNKQKDPTWFKPGHGPIPPGHPENELGTRWMPLEPLSSGLPGDLGIHGTIAPETIGQYKSHGCPRMLKEDVEELYDLVVRSTPVRIVEVFKPEAGQMAGSAAETGSTPAENTAAASAS
jgi:lipoprotein-anchoring transpeptidase ErfK/SrfK/Flp pilus assembly protein TadD